MSWTSKWAPPQDGGFTDKLKQSIEAEVGCNPEELCGVPDAALGVPQFSQKETQTIQYTSYKRRTIEVKHNNKKRIVEVTVVGDLGLDFDDDGWNIYHLPTLACFDMAVPECDKTPYDNLPLLNWMAKVQEQYPTAWQMLACLTYDDYENKGKSAKEIIQKWCLSVKVE